MAFNKSKALEGALKYLHQGKVSQAISEYQQILRSDPKDQATLMTVGDLYARQGDMSHAIEYFERLAQVYLNDGFNSKAIAIYKKIAKLAPAELAPLERLADLYVQQGVLSEARPLFLQIAEAHLKANRAPKAVEVLHRLLEVEPENPRVQMRLAELYNVMGQKQAAARTYLGYAQRLFDRSDTDESQKLVERALEADSTDAAARLLKAKIFAMAGKDDPAIEILEKHPEADAGGEVTNLLVDLELRSGQIEKAVDRARNQLVRGNTHFGLLLRVADSLVEKGNASEALPLLRELRDPMIEVSEHDKFVKSLEGVIAKLPGNTEPLEMLADFCRHASDPFPLNAALTQLVDIYEPAGNDARAEELLEELVDRNKGDERLVARLNQLLERTGRTERIKPQPEVPTEPSSADQGTAPEETPATADEHLDPETQRYVAQALTDVDLFSSYGLTQKATHLLESVLQRAPQHTTTLERLLDLSVGAASDRRTAEIAAQLEQIHRERGDAVNADRFTELRKRFQEAAGLTDEQLKSEPVSAPLEITDQLPLVEIASLGAVPVDFTVEPEPEPAELEVPLIPVEPGSSLEEALEANAHAREGGHAAGAEVDLSDEWEAMVLEVIESPPPAVSEQPPPAPPVDDTQLPSSAPAAEEPAVFEIQDMSEESSAEPFELIDETTEETAASYPEGTENGGFELELTPELVASQEKPGAATTEEFLSELAAEIEDMDPPSAFPEPVQSAPSLPEPVTSRESEPALISEDTTQSLSELSEVFQEFRSELGELGEEDEDLETHYSLGIAYREMGLLDEAIGEFQKVAKSVQKGKPFRYAMNCATLLALSFSDKGEPKIAALWYRRALDVPGLEPEAVLALRYDLGISLELAGEPDAALDCFRQVYAMNIDYRDVADRIATLHQH